MLPALLLALWVGISGVQAKSGPRKEIKKWTAKGLDDYEKGRKYDALTAFEYVLAMDSTSKQALYYRGMIRWNYRDTLGAMRDFACLTRSYPKWAVAHQALGSVLAESGHYYEASVVLKEASFLDPYDASTWYHLGLCAYRMRDLDSAAMHYQMALGLDSVHTGALTGIGWIYAQQGKNELAASVAERALRADQKLHPAWYLKAMAVADDDPAFALLCIEKAIAIYPAKAYTVYKQALQSKIRAKAPLYGKIGR